MEHKKKLLNNLQKAHNEIRQQNERIQQLEADVETLRIENQEIQLLVQEKQNIIAEQAKRIGELENTLRLFYVAIEKDEERLNKDIKRHNKEEPLMTAEDMKRAQFERDMEEWRTKEERKRKSETQPQVSYVEPAAVTKPLVEERPSKLQKNASNRATPVPKQVEEVSLSFTPLTIVSPVTTAKKPLDQSPATIAKRRVSQLQNKPINSPAGSPRKPLTEVVVNSNKPNASPLTKKPILASKSATTPQLPIGSPNSSNLSLFGWCKKYTSPNSVKDFTKSWADGIALCCLINNFYPGTININKLNPDNHMENITLGLDTAEKLGVAKLIDAEDFGKERNSMMTYLSQVYKVFGASQIAQQKQPVLPIHLQKENMLTPQLVSH